MKAILLMNIPLFTLILRLFLSFGLNFVGFLCLKARTSQNYGFFKPEISQKNEILEARIPENLVGSTESGVNNNGSYFQ